MTENILPHEIRKRAGFTQMEIAARSAAPGRSPVSLGTIRLYESDPAAVRESTRRVLDPIYAALRPEGLASPAWVDAQASAPVPWVHVLAPEAK
jgi:hypothetical protein